MKNKTKLAIGVILTAIISMTTVYAAFLLAHSITTTLIVKPVVSMGVFEPDGITPLNSIDMGQFQQGMTKYFPGGEPTTPTEYYYINNTDQLSFYVNFRWSNLPPASANMDVYIKRGDQTTFTKMDGTSSNIYQLPIMTKLDDPDPAKQYAIWYFIFTVHEIPFGTYTPTLTINAYDTATG